jgi:DUF1680 family protein
MKLAVLCLLSAPVFAALPKPAVPDKVPDQFIPAPFESQKIDGLLGDRMRVNLEGRLLHLDEKGVIEGFQHRPGQQDWIGEHAGKFLDAAAKTWEYTHDERLKTLMDRVAHELIAAQLPDGYLGTYTDDKRWTSWDVWVHKYDLIGLLSYYRITGDESSIHAARKIGDLLVRTFGDKSGQRDIILSGTHVGMAATSVLEPMVMLYRYTGNRAYLDFCYYLTRAWEQPDGPHILSSLTTNGSVFHTANAKAYEMLSNLVGLADLYRITGEQRFLAPLRIAWDDIVARRLYISGTASSHEHFTDNDLLPADQGDDVGEGCVTVTWMQLNWQLLRLTGEARFGDELERSIFNQLLAAQNPQNGDICYFTPLNGRKKGTPGINCCVSSEPRGISMIPQTAWGERDGGIAIVQYVPGHLKTSVAAIESTTTFPNDGRVVLTVTPANRANFPVFLRVPAWTKQFTATVGGQSYHGHTGEFLVLDRAWKAGDRVEIQMDMTVELLSGGISYPNSVAIQRGPQILALESELNPPAAAGPAATLNLRDASAQLPATWPEHTAFAVDGKRGQPLILVPFADAREYQVWLPRP